MSMLSTLRSLWGSKERQVRPVRGSQTPSHNFRPKLEGLEDRCLMAHGALAAPLAPAALVGAATPAAVNAANLSIPIEVTNIRFSQGQLLATLNVAGQTVTAPLQVTATPGEDGCTILNLELDRIRLNVLGLRVDTSRICLNITSNGEGLLGNLLCNPTGGLGGLTGATDLTDLLPDLSGRVRNQLLRGLTNVFNQALEAADLTGTTGGHRGNRCEILDLKLGPVDLDVLGVNVRLDNCNDGPVRVRITGQENTLLGGLLCGLADGGILDGLPLNRIQRLVGNLIQLGNLLDGLNL